MPLVIEHRRTQWATLQKQYGEPLIASWRAGFCRTGRASHRPSLPQRKRGDVRRVIGAGMLPTISPGAIGVDAGGVREPSSRRAERAMKDRCRGALIGLAVGDALGAAVEFSSPGSFAPVSGYRSG